MAKKKPKTTAKKKTKRKPPWRQAKRPAPRRRTVPAVARQASPVQTMAGTISITSANCTPPTCGVSGTSSGIQAITVVIVEQSTGTVFCSPAAPVFVGIGGNWNAMFNCSQLQSGYTYVVIAIGYDGTNFVTSLPVQFTCP